MTGAEYIWSVLQELTGSKHVFTMSGGGIMHLTDALGRELSLTPVPMHHEQACAFAAMAYGRTINSVGVCLVTSGPGGTNAITGVAAAYLDSVPMLIISGNVSSQFSQYGRSLRQRGFQEFDIVNAVKSFTKFSKYTADIKSLAEDLDMALYVAKNGRPGPVWLDIPLDVQAAEIAPKPLRFVPDFTYHVNNPMPNQLQIDNILEKLNSAKRPLILMGHGVVLSGARELARQLADKLRVPIQTTWNALDLIPGDHPRYFGRSSFYGPRYANFIVQNADYILAIGTRLSIQTTGWNVRAFARYAWIDMIDLDEAESKKPDLLVDRYFKLDAKILIEKLAQYEVDAPLKWLQYCDLMKATYPVAPNCSDKYYVDPYYFFSKLSELLPEDALVPLGSSGTAFSVAGQVFKTKKNQRVFNSKGMAAMGTGLPASIGACIAADKRAVTVIGDGGLQLNLQELQTIRHNKLPVKIFVLSNEGYNAIQTTQKTYFSGRFVGADKNSGVSFPSIEGLARLYGLDYYKIQTDSGVESEIENALKDDEPALIEVMLDPEKQLMPKAGSKIKPDGTFESLPLEDLVPLLPRDEYESNML